MRKSAVHAILAGVITLMPGLAVAETPALTILTYDSFTSEWGPGPAAKKAFEARCDCQVNFVTAGDGAAMLSRLQLEGKKSKIDVVLGLDTNLTSAAAESNLFVPHGVPSPDALPIDWQDPLFLPYDWGWLAFVYDKTRLPEPPSSFADLAASDVRIVIPDPRASTPGLGLLLWVKDAYGDQAASIWRDLADNIVTVTPGWSEAYALFLRGEADMVLSYTTSPAFHRLAENDDSKDWARFDEGHYLQIEVAGLLATAPQPELGRDFLAFLQSPEFQSLIPETNWMYPVIDIPLPDGFDNGRPDKTLLLPDAEAASLRDKAVAEWRSALAR